jgi:integrase
VKPVPEVVISAMRPFVSLQVSTMIELQLLTGMRPGEVCLMRASDLDTSSRVWVYRPESHKTEHHGHERQIFIGPKAQEILRPWLKLNTQAYLFSKVLQTCSWPCQNGLFASNFW